MDFGPSRPWRQRRVPAYIFAIIVVCAWAILPSALLGTAMAEELPLEKQESDTWAVIVNASSYFLNYRHTVNAMVLYHALKRLGLPDSRIVLMHADCATCDARMVEPGTVFFAPGSRIAPDSEDSSPEVDYRDKDVTADNVLRVLTGNTRLGTSQGQVLGSTNSSNVLLFLTGHGGDGFLKFHDQSELMSSDLGSAVEYMHMSGRYKNMFIILDTCQASTMYEDIAAEGWAGVASSKRDQSSYALNSDSKVGTFLIDEFSHWMTNWLNNEFKRGQRGSSQTVRTLEDMLGYVMRQRMSSEVQYDSSRVDKTILETFFGADVGRHGLTGIDGGYWSDVDKLEQWNRQLIVSKQ